MRIFRAVMPALVFLLLAQTTSAAPVKLSTITLNPGSATGGTSVTGTATLTTAPGRGGVTVTLTSSNTAAATVPANVVVPQNATSATFTVTTSPVAAQANVVITGNYQATATATLSVLPPAIADLTISPAAFTAVSETAQALITLNGNAPASGTTVSLTSSSSAAVVPLTASVAPGQLYGVFTITGNQVPSATTAVISASAGGNNRLATVTVNPCVPPTVNAPWAFPPADVTWFDDTLPPGMTLGTATWDTTQAASGTQSLKLASASGAHGATLSGATSTLTINPGEHLVTYFMFSDCERPREIVFSWHIAGGAWKSAYWGTPLIGGESGFAQLNLNPSQHTWTRVDVAASQLGLDGATIDGFRVEAYDGKVWFDRVGKTCVPPFATPPAQITDTIWVDDSIPSSNTNFMAWDTTQHASGVRALTTGEAVTSTQWYSIGNLDPATPFHVGVGEKLTLWVLLNSCTPPSGLTVLWGTNSTGTITDGRASWGTMSQGTYMGAMPSAGGWVRLEIPASAVGLEDRDITLFNIAIPGGSLWIDAIGKAGPGCTPAFATPPSIPSGDSVVIEDALPSGATTNGTWDSGQHASGTKSIRGLYYASGVHETYASGLSMPVHYNHNLVAYVLLGECGPAPTAMAIVWEGDYRGGIYWGTPSNWSDLALLKPAPMPMPTPGVWTRIEIPARLVNLEEQTVNFVGVRIQGAGQVWLDHAGTSGTACFLGNPSQPVLPPSDVVWIDDPPVSGTYSNVTWTTARAASGTQSIVEGAVCLNCGGFNQIDDFSPPGGITSLQSTDKLVFYMLVNECAPPSEIMIRWGLWSGDVKGVYWGTPHNLGEGTLYQSMGAVPAGGSWVRVEVPVSQLGITPGTYSGSVRSLFFYAYDGQVWFDRLGKSQ